MIAAIAAMSFVQALAQGDTRSNRVTLSYEVMKTDFNQKYGQESVKGMSAGYMRIAPIAPQAGISLEYGGKLTWLHSVEKDLGNSYNYYNYTQRCTFMNISIPVSVLRPFALGNSDFSIRPFLGPNFKFNIIGKYKETHESKDGGIEEDRYINYLKRDNRYPAKIFQFGMNIGVGVTFRQLYLGYTFQPDFTKYIDGNAYYVDGQSCKTQSHSISLGIRF